MQHGLYKFLSTSSPRADPTKLEEYNDKKIRVVGILYLCMGEINHQRFIKSTNAEDPAAIWKALMDYYESNSIQNQSIVYQEFLALEYKKSVSTFLDELDACLRAMSAVGLVPSLSKPNSPQISPPPKKFCTPSDHSH
ncbi:uncharacterized protein VP01_14586g1 [Puccinia sorghi]|uniref:Uncharacterized protein n=1 Tax=Puccinia sorghi TaxID=27349 RepID=A0A0L6VJV6_9BASI|nr:uncharacterized protein VP01_14586g1 [Puccinia sorghi]